GRLARARCQRRVPGSLGARPMRSRAFLLLVLTRFGWVVDGAGPPASHLPGAPTCAPSRPERACGHAWEVEPALHGSSCDTRDSAAVHCLPLRSGNSAGTDCPFWPARYPLLESRLILAASRRVPQIWLTPQTLAKRKISPISASSPAVQTGPSPGTE